MANTIDTKATLEALKATAAAQVKQYPQYAGHFAGYRLARMRKNVRTKMGQAFVAGEYVIAAERDASHPLFTSTGPKFVTAWSRTNACDTSVQETVELEWIS